MDDIQIIQKMFEIKLDKVLIICYIFPAEEINAF